MCQLSQIEFLNKYRTGENNIVSDFYLPALKCAKIYIRSVGYFTSSGFAAAAQGISAIANSEGKIRLIASPVLDNDDFDAIRNGYNTLEERIHSNIISEFDECNYTPNFIQQKRLETLSNLILEEKLDIKIAIRVNNLGNPIGIYHEKLGVIRDATGNYIAFDGSSNETRGGLIDNFERINVHKSWYDPEGRAKGISDDLINLWANSTPNLRVIPFTEVSAELFERYKVKSKSERQPLTEEEEVGNEIELNQDKSEELIDFSFPKDFPGLRGYQVEAIDNWFKNGCRGIYSLATGTGKTKTAIGTAIRAYAQKKANVFLILCPYKNLVEQWSNELKKCGVDAILAYKSKQSWHDRLAKELYLDREELLVVISTFATFCKNDFQENIIDLFANPKGSMIIADEAHHLGSDTLFNNLPKKHFHSRLGLSATPERYHDPVGSDNLLNYFGKILKPEISVKYAIDHDYLCRYEYHPIFVHLDEEESFINSDIEQRISSLLSDGQTYRESEQINELFEKDTKKLSLRIGVKNKLKELLDATAVSRTLIYCGAGRANFSIEEVLPKQSRIVEEIVELVSDCGITVRQYTSDTSQSDRESILTGLDEGNLQAVVAINCLDEGVDIPSIETAIILSSSNNPRQFIQRRGRVLRISTGKTKARIFDMVLLPSISKAALSDAESQLLTNQLIRYKDFANDAINKMDALEAIAEVQRKYTIICS